MLQRRKPWLPKRKPLPKRKKAMRKVSAKKRKQDRDAKAMFEEYHQTHTSCAVCGWFAGTAKYGHYGRSLHDHHLAKGSARKHDRRLVVRTCDRCHRHLHDGGELDETGKRLPPLTDGHMLQAKYESDPDYYSEQAICDAYGWAALPEKWQRKPIPDEFRGA